MKFMATGIIPWIWGCVSDSEWLYIELQTAELLMESKPLFIMRNPAKVGLSYILSCGVFRPAALDHLLMQESQIRTNIYRLCSLNFRMDKTLLRPGKETYFWHVLTYHIQEKTRREKVVEAVGHWTIDIRSYLRNGCRETAVMLK